MRTQYTVPATLLVAFQNDAIDESAEMAALLRQVQPMGAAIEEASRSIALLHLQTLNVTVCMPPLMAYGQAGPL